MYICVIRSDSKIVILTKWQLNTDKNIKPKLKIGILTKLGITDRNKIQCLFYYLWTQRVVFYP